MSEGCTKQEASVYHDDYYDTLSIEIDGDTRCVFWRLDEESHQRHPFDDAEKYANEMVRRWNYHATLLEKNERLKEREAKLVEACKAANSLIQRHLSSVWIDDSEWSQTSGQLSEASTPEPTPDVAS